VDGSSGSAASDDAKTVAVAGRIGEDERRRVAPRREEQEQSRIEGEDVRQVVAGRSQPGVVAADPLRGPERRAGPPAGRRREGLLKPLVCEPARNASGLAALLQVL